MSRGGRRGATRTPFDARTALAAARRAHMAGRGQEAAAQYRRVLEAEPDNADALSLFGLLAHQAGRNDMARTLLRKAVGLRPGFADARLNLGAVLRAEGDLDGAAREFKAAAQANPRQPAARHNLGLVLEELGRFAEAAAAFQALLALDPGSVEARVDLARTLRADGRNDEAAACYRAILAIAPATPGAHIELGNLAQEEGRAGDAIAHYETALTIDPDNADAFRNIGIANLALGRHADAKAAFHDVLRVNSGGAWWNAPSFAAGARQAPPPGDAPLRASAFKLADIADQLDYLMARGRLDASFAEMVARYRAVRDEVAAAVGEDGTTALTPDQRARIGAFHNKVVHYADTPRIAAGAVNDGLDFAALEDGYLESPISITAFDDFLTPEALGALRAFCLESTVFHAYSGSRFVGADLAGGFNCAVLYQIAEELKQRMPRVLGRHALTNVWAYRHRNETVGVEAHTDQGAVTFNFWITPDEANLEPDRGGLQVYAKEQPYDWDWRVYNRFKYAPRILDEINAFLDAAETVTIPYRGNRAVLFHSNLFHKSDTVRFKPGFENRRVNITMLFGRRGAG